MALPKYTEPHYRIWHYVYLTICAGVFFFLIAPLFVIFPLSFNAEEFLVFSDGMKSLDPDAFSLRWYKDMIYGQQMPINQIGSITTPEPRTINIQVWDQNNVPLVDAAIKKSELGLNPQIDGQLIRLPIPELNEERRTELKKLIKSMGEKCKISIRNIRRDANEELKKLLKSKEIGEDEEKSFEKNVQTITDDHIKIVDDKVSSKEKEIMTI